ncbi:MAG TPA: tetratricopeptide repeat protein [Polyangia bacterium]|nr:tetratricopeptide repeat protein [Polyangia bacterium]
MRINNWSAALTVSVVLLAGAGVARAADPNAEKARAHFQQGDTYFKLDKYANALQEFEQAYLAKQDPSFLYNIAQCHRLMGNRADAIRFYKRYITDAPNAANRSVAEKHIRDLEAALDAEQLTGARPASPAPAPAMPAPQPAAPPPVAPLDARPPPPASDTVLTAPPSPPSPADEHPFYTKWWFWTAVGGVVVVSGLLLAVFLNRDPSCPTGRSCQ